MKATTSGPASRISRQATTREGCSFAFSRLVPPAISTISGTQWPATNRGSDHSRQNVRIVGRRRAVDRTAWGGGGVGGSAGGGGEPLRPLAGAQRRAEHGDRV